MSHAMKYILASPYCCQILKPRWQKIKIKKWFFLIVLSGHNFIGKGKLLYKNKPWAGNVNMLMYMLLGESKKSSPEKDPRFGVKPMHFSMQGSWYFAVEGEMTRLWDNEDTGCV